MTTTHATCTHEATKAPRAACRRSLSRLWTELVNAGTTAQNSEAFAQADRNADDTVTDEGFALYSDRWYEIFNATYSMILDQGVPS